MTGMKSAETLNFYLKEEKSLSFPIPLWKAQGDLGLLWYSHRMTVNSTIDWRIVFDVGTHLSEYGLIAIDDVFVDLDKSCPPSGRCDFEVSYRN